MRRVRPASEAPRCETLASSPASRQRRFQSPSRFPVGSFQRTALRVVNHRRRGQRRNTATIPISTPASHSSKRRSGRQGGRAVASPWAAGRDDAGADERRVDKRKVKRCSPMPGRSCQRPGVVRWSASSTPALPCPSLAAWIVTHQAEIRMRDSGETKNGGSTNPLRGRGVRGTVEVNGRTSRAD